MTLGLELTRVADRIQNEQQESAQIRHRRHQTAHSHLHHPRGSQLVLRRPLQDLLTEAASVVQVHGQQQQQSSLER